MFYTDTNGKVPQKRCLVLVCLEAAMENRLPYELHIETFNGLKADIDKLDKDLQRFKELGPSYDGNSQPSTADSE